MQIEAIQAAGEMKSPLLLSALADKLAQQKTVRAAGLALAAYGDDGVAFLGSILEDVWQKQEVKIHIPKIMRTIGTQQALDVLTKNIDINDDGVRHNVIIEMTRMIKSSRHLQIETENTTSLLAAETRNYYQQIAVLSEVENKIESRLLGEALNLQALRTGQRLLALLAVLYPDQPIESIALGLKSAAPSVRANSLELLDNILEGDQKHLVLAVFEDDTIEKKHKLGRAYFKTLREDSFTGWLQYLLGDDDHWIVACTIYQIGVSQVNELSGRLRQIIAEEDDPLLLETARLDLNRLRNRRGHDFNH